jgi:hypothetical protein
MQAAALATPSAKASVWSMSVLNIDHNPISMLTLYRELARQSVETSTQQSTAPQVIARAQQRTNLSPVEAPTRWTVDTATIPVRQ